MGVRAAPNRSWQPADCGPGGRGSERVPGERHIVRADRLPRPISAESLVVIESDSGRGRDTRPFSSATTPSLWPVGVAARVLSGRHARCVHRRAAIPQEMALDGVQRCRTRGTSARQHTGFAADRSCIWGVRCVFDNRADRRCGAGGVCHRCDPTHQAAVGRLCGRALCESTRRVRRATAPDLTYERRCVSGTSPLTVRFVLTASPPNAPLSVPSAPVPGESDALPGPRHRPGDTNAVDHAVRVVDSGYSFGVHVRIGQFGAGDRPI